MRLKRLVCWLIGHTWHVIFPMRGAQLPRVECRRCGATEPFK